MTKLLQLISVTLLSVILLTPFIVGCTEGPIVEENGSVSPTTEEITVYVKEAQANVDAVRALQPTDIPDHLTEDYNTVKTGEEFDINEYFSVLTHLSMEPGYILDYVYPYDWGFGGRPLIYVRRVEDDPFSNYEEYSAAEESSVHLDDVYDFVGFVMGGDPKALGNKIMIDGTAEGFFEYVILQIMGGQFYLSWHANYDDARIICDQESLESTLVESLESLGIDKLGGSKSRSELLAKACHIDFQPVVTFQADTVVVTIIFFTKWGGFIQSAFTISKDYPHNIISISNVTIIEYDCWVTF